MEKIYVKKVQNLVFAGSKRVSPQDKDPFTVLYFTDQTANLITLFGSADIVVPSKSVPCVVITSSAEGSTSSRVESLIEV